MSVGSVDRTGSMLDGKWRIERQLGAGGMGEVYEAVHVRNAKRVAIKLLRAEIADAETMRRFLREGYLSNVVDDPGVVSAFDDGTAPDGSPYIVMELLEGESLEERAERQGGRMDWREALSLLSPALVSLAKAHAVGVVHRDLKPSNLFLTRDGRVKVLDFGLAGLRSAPELRVTAPDAPTMGTLGFMPPEQVRGEWERVDARSDLWAMGATLFTLLTGRCVHENGPEAQFLKRAMLDRAPSLASLAPSLPPLVIELCDRALAFEPEARFQSAVEMQRALAAAYHGLTGRELEDGPTSLDALPGLQDGVLDRPSVLERLGTSARPSASGAQPAHAGDSPSRSHGLRSTKLALGLVLLALCFVPALWWWRTREGVRSSPPEPVAAGAATSVLIEPERATPPSSTPEATAPVQVRSEHVPTQPLVGPRPAPSPGAPELAVSVPKRSPTSEPPAIATPPVEPRPSVEPAPTTRPPIDLDRQH